MTQSEVREALIEAVKLAHDESGLVDPNWNGGDEYAVAVADRVLPIVHAEIERLREALRPFAEAADNLEDGDHDAHDLWESSEAMLLTCGDLRKARAALTDGGSDAG